MSVEELAWNASKSMTLQGNIISLTHGKSVADSQIDLNPLSCSTKIAVLYSLYTYF